MTDPNPFSMVFSALWTALLNHPKFTTDVKDRNRIRFDSETDRDPLKDQVQAADLPEVAIIASTGNGNLHDTSSSTKMVRQYALMVSTGDYRYSEILSRVEWYMLAALLGWKSQIATVEWNGQKFVKRVNIVSTQAGMSDPRLNRNITGWSTVWAVEVEMHFNTADLLSELTDAGDSDN